MVLIHTLGAYGNRRARRLLRRVLRESIWFDSTLDRYCVAGMLILGLVC
jgi:hypothetical protein